MSVDVIVPAHSYDAAESIGTDGIEGIPPGTACFYCSKPMELRQRVIVWRGHGPETKAQLKIAMHPACALQLTIRLNRDVYDAQAKGSLKIQ